MEFDRDPGYDAKFEFDAPRYCDFESMRGATPCDKWFDTAPDGPGYKADKGATVVARVPFKETQEEQQQAVKQPPHQNEKKSNIVTSWGNEAAAAAGQKPVHTSTEPDQHLPAAGVRKSLGIGARRISGRQDAPRSEPPVTRSMSRLIHTLCSPVPEGKACHYSTPMARGRKCATARKAQPTATRTKPAAVQRLHDVLEPKIIKPMRSIKPLTLPDDFELETTKRAAAAGQQEQPKVSPYKSLAEKVREFQSKTPVRFKGRASKPTATKQQHSITLAQSPQLMTSTRSRPGRFKSQQELEEEHLQQAHREQFTARPLDSRVLNSAGELGVPKVDKPRITESRPFTLRSGCRVKTRHSHMYPSAEEAAVGAGFRAKPLHKSILDGPTFQPHKHKHDITVPRSPLLRTKLRAHTVQTEQPSKTGKLQAAAGTKGAAAGSASYAPPTRSFYLQTEVRGALHEQELAAKLAAEEARANRLRRVTARPLPVSVDVPLVPPKPDPKPLTLPDPFALKSLARHEEYETERKRKLQKEEEAAAQAAEFKAQPLPVAAPFMVHESDAPLTVPVDPHLATEARAVDRLGFDEHVADKRLQEEEDKKRLQELKRQQEEEEVREYRKKLRFSARPMPRFSQPYFAMPSDKPLTNPKTPNFATKRMKKL